MQAWSLVKILPPPFKSLSTPSHPSIPQCCWNPGLGKTLMQPWKPPHSATSSGTLQSFTKPKTKSYTSTFATSSSCTLKSLHKIRMRTGRYSKSCGRTSYLKLCPLSHLTLKLAMDDPEDSCHVWLMVLKQDKNQIIDLQLTHATYITNSVVMKNAFLLTKAS